jgi:pyruvate dehydrogenase complex dehydrogenase (E1) component
MGIHDTSIPPTGFTPGDSDPAETRDWLASFEGAASHAGKERAKFLLERLEERAKELGILTEIPPFSPYRNTIPLDEQPAYPGDLAAEERNTSIIRWNALAMVMRANAAHGDLGGHIAKSSRWVSITFSRRRLIRAKAISCSSSRIPRPVSTRAHSWKAG